MFLLASSTADGYGQIPLTVTPNAGNAMPNPAFTNETVTSVLTATVANPPSGTYTCPLSSPLWVWSITSVQLNGANPTVPFDVAFNQNSSNSANATLTGSFSGGGAWVVTLSVSVTYTDSPCNDVWIGSATVAVAVSVVDVELSPNPLVLPVGSMASVTVTTTPSSYASSVTVNSADPSIAGVSGSSPNYTVTGLQPGSTNLLCYCWGRQCPAVFPVYVFTANLNVNNITGAAKLNPGAYVPINANNDNGSTVTNGVPAIRDMNTNPIADEKDLVLTILQVTGLPANWPVSYTLSVSKVANAHGDVRFWNTMTKQFQYSPLPYTWIGTAGAWPNCYMEGVAEGYAQREIALTLQVIPNGATGPSSDVVNVTVTPVLQTLTVTRSAGFTFPNIWYVTPAYVDLGTRGDIFISNGGQNVPAGTPAVNMSATALNTNLGGQLCFIQSASIINNLNQQTVGAIMDTTNKIAVYTAPNTAGKALIDCSVAADIPYYINSTQGIHKITNADGAQTVMDQDTPKASASGIMPLVNQKNNTQVDVSQQFTLRAVWQYPAPDNTYWPLGQVTWSVRYAGAITVAVPVQFNAGANNAVNSSSPLVRGNSLPKQALTVSANPAPNQTPIANNGSPQWVVLPGS